ncbi:MAG: 2-amino-4-hydroxy-6-hydroxymethyldihydropteridine diphosphokinase [Candidatus Eisenbacteria sp.]|nr:2-amino-4-hydroxy-6-hydroxymethyldihydropteridine diphosphokinase [Candidatus Eisenbacteria bacterium]
MDRRKPAPRAIREAAAERIAAVALGSNLGSRQQYLNLARRSIAARLGDVVCSSSIYETQPVGPSGQGKYLNQVVVIDTPREPEELVELALAIEKELGRKRGVRWGGRCIDLDLLLHGSRVRSSDGLTLPHARMHQRAFVLVPLAEVLPDWRHPLLDQTVCQMCAACGDGGVERWDCGRVPHGALTRTGA